MTTKPLGRIVGETDLQSKTLHACNVTDESALATVSRFLSKHEVEKVKDKTASGQPRDTLVLQSDGRFVAANSIQTVARFASRDDQPSDRAEIPAVIQHLDGTRFRSYDKRRMIMASRNVEFRAWNDGEGTLHSGFQQLSKVDFQRNVYRNLSRSDLDVHVYGQADWERPDDLDLTVHASDAKEVTKHWWVVYDGNGRDDRKAALLAQETGDNEFYGFWTYDARTTDEVLDRLAAMG
ncbi:DICT sensory domain-containing protein [Haloarchaeobius amylolyticus]|uniref:DICT sensory domain-containing protein n=1 Tax=Haloarchaeobius amylolyticus TaxID=1198296 RepID=UPI00226E5069|nr:DICT sensory domain-containing protein [Haloarchaeobius amylolyticus]